MVRRLSQIASTVNRPHSAVRVAQGISYFATLGALIGAVSVIIIFKPSPKPWLYGILKCFLAGALTIALIADTLDTKAGVFSSLAFAVGGGLTILVVAPLTSDPPTGPNKIHPADEGLSDREVQELAKREFDSPKVRERAIMGGILTAVVVGIRNLAYGIWFFSLANSGRWLLQFPHILVFLAPQFVTLGAAVAVPLYFGTKSRWKTVLAVAVSSAAYPLGYNMASLTLPSAATVFKFLEFAGGLESVSTLYWMFYSSLEHTPWRHCTVAVSVGLGCMAGIRFGMLVGH